MAGPGERPRALRLYGDRVLREVCRPVAPDEPGLDDLIARMTATMERYRGVGLAAPQVGVPLRLFLAWLPEWGGRPPMVFVNPERVSASDREVPFDEGCLSFPGIYRDVIRPDAVTVAYRDETGAERRMKAEGLLARIIQHEMDHLDGVLFVDHLDWRSRLGVKLDMVWRRLWTRREV